MRTTTFFPPAWLQSFGLKTTEHLFINWIFMLHLQKERASQNALLNVQQIAKLLLDTNVQRDVMSSSLGGRKTSNVYVAKTQGLPTEWSSSIRTPTTPTRSYCNVTLFCLFVRMFVCLPFLLINLAEEEEDTTTTNSNTKSTHKESQRRRARNGTTHNMRMTTNLPLLLLPVQHCLAVFKLF